MCCLTTESLTTLLFKIVSLLKANYKNISIKKNDAITISVQCAVSAKIG